jgi:prophage regulatory protein
MQHSTTTTTVPRRFLNLNETAKFAGISRSTLLRYEKADLFPRRRRLGPGRVAWAVSELEAWADAREAV